MRTKGSAAELERRRLLAVRRVEEGYSQADVARFLGVHARTVRAWVRLYRSCGEGGLAAIPHPGRCPKLLPSQEATVLGWLTQNPRDHGFATELWTAPRVALLIRRHWGITFHPRYLNQWLARRRISSQKPVKQPRERDEEAIARWVRDEWPRILVEASRQQAHLVLIDESGLLMAPLVRRSLAPKGRPLVLKHKGRHRDKVSLMAALTVSPTGGELGLHFRTYPNSYVNNEKAAGFLEALLEHLHGRVIVVWDRGNMHKGEPIRQLLARHPRLSLEALPPYAPQLNPVEQLWAYLKYAELANYAPRDFRELDGKAQELLLATTQDAQRLKSFWDHCQIPSPTTRLLEI